MRSGHQRPEDPAARAARWLHELDGFIAQPETLKLLARCDRKEEVEFLVAFISAPGWFLFDEQSFANQDWKLTPKAPIAGHSVDVLIESRHNSEVVALDIVEDRMPLRGGVADEHRESAIRAVVGNYQVGKAKDVPLVAKHIRATLDAIAGKLPPYSSARYAIAVAPGLVWQPLPENFELWGDGARIRQQRLAHWLREHGYRLPGHLLPLLATCDWYGAVKFALPVLLAGPWKLADSRTAMNGSTGIRIKGSVGQHQVDFLLGRLNSRTRPPIAIDIRKPRSWKRPHEEQHRLAREEAARAAGYQYLLIEPDDALTQGHEWARLLRDARVDQETREQGFRAMLDQDGAAT